MTSSTPVAKSPGFSAFLQKLVEPAEFPQGAFVPPERMLHAVLAGRSFLASSRTLGQSQVEFACDGSFSVVTQAGFRSGGRWRCERGTLYTEIDGIGPTWQQVRVSPDCNLIFVKRHAGEVMRYEALSTSPDEEKENGVH